MENNNKQRKCQWFGSNNTEQTCDAECIDEKSYCEEHVWQVYQKDSAQIRRRATFKQVSVEYWEDMFEQAVRELADDA